jgi:hypothetical protein
MYQGHDTPSPFLSLFSKTWPHEFSEARKPDDDRPCVEEIIEHLHSIGEEFEGDDCQLFMKSYDEGIPSFDIRNAIRFIRGSAGASSLHNQYRSRKKGTAWLDDRTRNSYNIQHATITGAKDTLHTSRTGPGSLVIVECDITDATLGASHSSHRIGNAFTGSHDRSPDMSRAPRSYILPLTADALRSHLREKRFDHPTYMDADRRLIHVADPDSYDFLALIKTAPAHQQRSLRDVICKHLALDTSIKATIPEEGYSVFQLEFHMPYFALRCSQLKDIFAQRKKRAHRGWMNIAFLNTKDKDPEEDGTWGIHQAQISVTICGTDNSHWIAYCFEDRHFDEDGELGQDEHTSIHQSDQIAGGEFGAEDTIWDPREYFLRVLLIRMRQVHKEWEELVRKIESGIKEHSWGRFFFSTTRDGRPSDVNHAAASTWIDSTVQLLGKLLDDIARTNDAWASFTSANGDLAYFSDAHTNAHMVRTFNQLKDVFDHLLGLQKRLQRIAEQCEKRAQTVNLRLTSDSMKSTELTVYFISPFAIVSTFFAIPVPIIGFERNGVSFLIAMLLYAGFLQTMLFFWGGKLWRQPWWEKLSRIARAIWNGDGGLTTKNEVETIYV